MLMVGRMRLAAGAAALAVLVASCSIAVDDGGGDQAAVPETAEADSAPATAATADKAPSVTAEGTAPATTEPVPSGESNETPTTEISTGTYDKWVYEETASGNINAATGEFVSTGDIENASTALFVSCRRDPVSGQGTVGLSVYIRNATIDRTTNTIYWDLSPANVSNGSAGEQNWSVGRPPTNMLMPPNPRALSETLRDNPDNLLTFTTTTGSRTTTALFDTSGADTTIGALIGKCDNPH